MSADAPTTPPTLLDGRYPSLAVLKAAHAALLRTFGTGTDPSPDAVRAVRDFLKAGAATGAILDTPDDRIQAQGLLDYWATRAGTAARKTANRGGRDATAAVPLTFEDTLLKEFNDDDAVRGVVEAARAWYAGLPPADQALTG